MVNAIQMKTPINSRLFFVLTIAFAFTAVAGTLLHECGHYIAARLFGYTAKISYAYTHWENKHLDSILNTTTHSTYPAVQQLPYSNEETVRQLQQRSAQNNFWITLAGPLQTMLTGSLGLLLIFISRKQYAPGRQLTLLQWVAIFLSQFWSRQTFNFFSWLGGYARTGHPPLQMDEVKLALYLHWPIGVLTAVTGLMGLAVSIYITFRIVPPNNRLTFITAGLLGGLGVYLLWINVVGPVVLPR